MESPNEIYETVSGTASNEELALYKKCFDSNESPKTLELLRWNHQENLPKTHSIYYAISKSSRKIAAIYTYLPVIFRCMGKTVTVMQSFDTLTDQDHRGKGLFIKLATAIENEQKQKEVEFVYGFPNENSVYGFLKKLRFHYFGEVPFLIKPFRISYIFKKFAHLTKSDSNENLSFNIPHRLLSKFDIREINQFDEKYERFYSKLTSAFNIGLERNARYMTWRYIKKPFESYGRYGLYDSEDNLMGVVIFALKRKHGGKIGYLMELLHAPSDNQTGRILLKFANRVLKKSSADIVLAWCFQHSFNYMTYKKCGYWIFPEKFRPQKLGVIVKLLNSSNSKEIYDLKNWYISYSDSDTV